MVRWMAPAGLAGVLLLSACGSSGSSATTGASAPATSATTAASPGGSAAASSAAGTVVIKSFMFGPMSLTVSPGAVVTVRNEDSTTHTLTDKSDPSVFNTGDIPAGQSKTFTAPKKPGRYDYICSIHQYMTGTLVVR
jgi:plastocyanin